MNPESLEPARDRPEASSYYRRNREARLAAARAYREAHLEACRERVRAWQRANPDRIRDNNRAYYLAHRDELLAKARERNARKRQAAEGPVRP